MKVQNLVNLVFRILLATIVIAVSGLMAFCLFLYTFVAQVSQDWYKLVSLVALIAIVIAAPILAIKLVTGQKAD